MVVSLKENCKTHEWHKEGVRENDQMILHPSDSVAWKALDDFDTNITRDARNVRIGLAMDGFMPYNTSVALYSCSPVFAIPYNLPPSLCMKYEYMFLCLIIPRPDHPGTCINMMLKPLIKKFKQLWEGVKAYDFTKSKSSTFELRICGRSMILGHTIFFRMELQWNSDMSDMYERHNLFLP
jgi:hypothetical protein